MRCVDAVAAAVNQHSITNIAIPVIGTGVFKFPKQLSASIMAEAFRKCLTKATSLQKIQFLRE
jgi:O-acetyl-ADP-ribose deacetylase (regulator of RNase III)